VRFEEKLVGGTEYLAMVTRLLHLVRLADPATGMWEAADLQWWWRRDRVTDGYGQLFLIDGQGEPVAGVIFTAQGQGEPCQCDVIIAPDHAQATFSDLWQRALSRMGELSLDAVELTVRDDDTTTLDAMAEAGFTTTGDTGNSSWLNSGDRPAVPPLPDGYRLLSRARTAGQTRPRNGA